MQTHYEYVDMCVCIYYNNTFSSDGGISSPLGGHLDVSRLLVEHSADVDSQDNRKVSCLMAAFRKVMHMHNY